MMKATKITKSIILFAAICFISANLFAESDPIYISPNNDGIQDILEVPLQIKEKRYVNEWSFIITNEQGEVVRTIGNKEKRPDRITFKNFFKQLLTPKSGVDIPSSVIWNGIMDSGETAPDGVYYYSFTATDDNGNTAVTSQHVVIVDNTAPAVEIIQPSNDEKIFGEGAKTSLPVNQSGSEEDLWTAEFSDSLGNIVRTITWTKSAPLKFDWNGTNDHGLPVADGVYSYKVYASDRAGNVSNPASITNIIYSAEKPVTNIAINGGRYFSPNGNGVHDTMSFDIKIPEPDQSKTGNKLVSWEVLILDENKKAVRTYRGEENPPSTLVFDGKTDANIIAPEGSYSARVTAKYLNGFEPVPVSSPVFVLDTSAPSADVQISHTTFSPDGDGNLDTLLISQATVENTGSPIKDWKGTVFDSEGNVVKEFDFGSFLPETVVWNGLDSENMLSADGNYNYVLTASDLAGNATSVSSQRFALDTSTTQLILTVAPQSFNPDSTNVRLTPVVHTDSQSGSSVSSYKLEIKDEQGEVVWAEEASRALPSSISWNGLSFSQSKCADGFYTATLSTVSTNGAEATTTSLPFEIDSMPPAIELSVPYIVFSPDADENKDIIPIVVTSSSAEDKWTGTIVNESNQIVRTYSWQGEVESFEWDGTDDWGNRVEDGTYKMLLTSVDSAGNKATAEVEALVVDCRETKAFVTAELDAFSPNGDDVFDTQTFNVRLSLTEGISYWSFNITSPEGQVVKSWSSIESEEIPEVIDWDGNDNDGNVAEGAFTGNLFVSYEKGNVINSVSSAFICTVTPPELSVRTAPQYFSPDNDGVEDDLYIQLKEISAVPIQDWTFSVNDPENGNPFWTVGGKSSITERLIWDGRGNNGELVQSAVDYPFVFTVNDTLGMSSTLEGKISVDVLVIRYGDVLKIAVPSIIFRSDAADFGLSQKEGDGGLTQAQVDNNERVLKRIAQILNKFKNYTVTVEGHANNVTGTEAEETSTAYGNIPLEPLSQARADFVVARLKKYGVSSDRLTAIGRGGRQPVVAREDKANWWKNRRVEFILHK